MIDGAPYWDGGFAGNPPLWPLFYETDCDDVIIVQINPIDRASTPRTPREINDRIDEITYNSGLLGELRAADFVTRLLDRGALDPAQYKRVNIHRIGGGGELEIVRRIDQDRHYVVVPDAPARSWPRGRRAMAGAQFRGDRRARHAGFARRAGVNAGRPATPC